MAMHQQEFSSKEKFLITNTLNCIPLLLQGHAVLIDMRNETSVAGRIDNADGYMNVNLVDAVFINRNGLHYPFDQFMVRKRMIRQIHMPADFDVEKELHNFMEQGLRKKKPQIKKNTKRTFKTKRAEVRHKEILQEIAESKVKKEGGAQQQLEKNTDK